VQVLENQTVLQVRAAAPRAFMAEIMRACPHARARSGAQRSRGIPAAGGSQVGRS
jgi:hypothetical protein